MTKKNRKAKNTKSAENESVEPNAELPETAQTEGEAANSNPNAADETSADDLLDDVRRSLIEEETQNAEKKKGWWKRTGRKKKSVDALETTESTDDFSTVIEPDSGLQDEPEEPEYLEQIDDLIEMLDKDVAVAEPIVETVEPEAAIDVDELKKRVFSPGMAGEQSDVTEVRSIALEGEGGEDVFVEVESKKEDTLDDQLKAFENSLRPYRRTIYFAVAFLGIVVAVLAGALMIRTYQQSRPVPTEVPDNLPFPRTLTLPGGLNFSLGKGAIVDGKWNPRGPEWLKGTEICRWVAIPWSTQLEAVVRTLKQKDTIELVMSNNDKLVYNVYSIKELTLEEMQALDSNSPCLLLVLAKQDSDKRWVVTALP